VFRSTLGCTRAGVGPPPMFDKETGRDGCGRYGASSGARGWRPIRVDRGGPAARRPALMPAPSRCLRRYRARRNRRRRRERKAVPRPLAPPGGSAVLCPARQPRRGPESPADRPRGAAPAPCAPARLRRAAPRVRARPRGRAGRPQRGRSRGSRALHTPYKSFPVHSLPARPAATAQSRCANPAPPRAQAVQVTSRPDLRPRGRCARGFPPTDVAGAPTSGARGSTRLPARPASAARSPPPPR